MNNNKRNTLKIIGAGAVASTIPNIATASPKRGGHLRIGMPGGSATDTFDPEKLTGVARSYALLTYNRLIQEVADTGELKPELATSWESKKQNREWILNLRKGVKFHDGSDFTADDVLYSIKLHTKEKTKSPGKSYLSALKEIVKTSSHQVKLVFNSPNPDVPAIFSLYHFPMVKNGHTDWLKPNGTGGYVITEFSPAVKTVGKRFADYWKKDSAWADKISLIHFQDSNASVNALLSGSVDVIPYVSPAIADRLAKSSRINVTKSSSKAHFSLPMLADSKEYKDLNVRKALKYGIDRKQVIDIGLNGYGTVGNDNPISSAYADYVPVKQISYDSDKSKYYLKKAGLSSFKANLHISTAKLGEGIEQSSLVFKESAKKAGIDINVVREPGDGYWSNIWMKKPFCGSKWSGRPTATMMFDVAYSSTAKWNESHFRNKTLDNLLKDAKSSSSAVERKAKLGEAQRIVTEEGSVIIPAFKLVIEASSSKVGGHLKTKGIDLNNLYFESFWLK